MAYVIAEISCAPNGQECYPVPTTFRICKVFGSGQDAAAEFDQDVLWPASDETKGQNVYYVLWKTDEPLNLDRCIQTDNKISNCGMWLSDDQRMYGDVDLDTELVAPERLQERAKKRQAAARVALRQKQLEDAKKNGGKRSVTTIDYDRVDTISSGGETDTGGPARGGAAAVPGGRYATPRAGTLWNRFA
jgi:hypothetical protein